MTTPRDKPSLPLQRVEIVVPDDVDLEHGTPSGDVLRECADRLQAVLGRPVTVRKVSF